MSWLCDRPCNNKTPFGYCKTTYCIYGASNQYDVTGYVPPLAKTNADRLRAMSDEELAKALTEISDRCPDGFNCDEVIFTDCCDCWLSWLQSNTGDN